MATFLEVRKSLFLIVYSWFFLLRSSRTRDTIHFLLLFVFLFSMQETFLKGKSNKSNNIYKQPKPHFIRCVISGRKGQSNLTEKKCFSSISNITLHQTLLTSADVTGLFIVFKKQFPMLYRCNRYCA